MEAIPEETSKVNLHSSHSRLGGEIASTGSAKYGGRYPYESRAHLQQENTVLCQYVKDLIASGKDENEVICDLETYYNTLVENCDNEILDLKEELEYQKADFREEAADEVYLKANEIDELSNIFIDCIHAHRKSLRQQLVKMKFKQNTDDTYQFDQSKSSLVSIGQKNSGKPNLLETYLRIVKTGAPEEIERFS